MGAKIKLDTYSHGFIVRTKDQRGLRATLEFVRTMVQYETVKLPPYYNAQKIPVRTFAGATKDRSEIRLHINQLEDYLRHMDSYGYGKSSIQIQQHEPAVYQTVDHPWNNSIEPREQQLPIIEFMSKDGQPIRVTNLQAGKGKFLAISDRIKIPDGWITHGDVKVGDDVIAWDGSQAEVIGVFPQGVVDMFEVTFHDGRSVRAGKEHLWTTYFTEGKDKEKWKVRDTGELKELIERSKSYSVYVPLITSEESADVELELDPYTSGQHLASLSKHHDIFIEDEYLHASRLQRLALVQGLMDARGQVANDSISFSCASEYLAGSFQYLIRSLGGIASITRRSRSYAYKGEKKHSPATYFVNISHPNPKELFKYSELKDKVEVSSKWSNGMKLKIKSIEYVGQEEAVCIAIDHPDQLYVTNDFIVTHNTAVSLMSMHNISRRTLLQLKGGYIERWLPDLKELFDYDDHEIIVVRGSKALKKLIQQGKDDEISAKVIIISSKTMHGFLKEFEALGDETTYGCRPEELYSLLEIGLKIIDEVHEDYHLNYRSDIYSNVARSIHLSATLETEDPFRRMIYEIALPKRHWYTGWKYDAYCHVRALHFNIEDAERLRTSERGRDTYSHNAFEKSIMKNKTLLKNYLEFIGDIVFFDFVENFEQGQRCLIFCGMVDMVELVRDYCRSRFPDLDTTEFVAGTPANVLTRHDIIVSTVQSCGTAVDIPNLTMALLTRALNKLETNEQVKSRLRKIKDWPELVPLFNYFVCDDIPKHVSYHRDKKEQFKGKVAKHEDVYTKRLLLSSKVKHQ